MQKYFTYIFSDKIDYGLSQQNIEVWKVWNMKWNDEQSETRRMWKKIHAQWSEAGQLFETYVN